MYILLSWKGSMPAWEPSLKEQICRIRDCCIYLAGDSSELIFPPGWSHEKDVWWLKKRVKFSQLKKVCKVFKVTGNGCWLPFYKILDIAWGSCLLKANACVDDWDCACLQLWFKAPRKTTKPACGPSKCWILGANERAMVQGK